MTDTEKAVALIAAGAIIMHTLGNTAAQWREIAEKADLSPAYRKAILAIAELRVCMDRAEIPPTIAELHEAELHDKTEITRLRAALESIAGLEPGSRGAYAKFSQAKERASEALRSKPT